MERVFDERTARHELRRYRRKGPLRTTRLLLDALRREGVDGKRLIDVGGGIGAIQHELLKLGAASAVSVDGSSAYIDAARSEAERQGFRDRVSYRHGDIVDIAPTLERADIVTLDRVICCYDALDDLLAASTGRSGELYAVVYPRAWPVTKAVVRVGNVYLKLLRRNPFRIFVHPPSKIDALIRGAGFAPRYEGKTLIWHVAVYARV
jgi:magnesium-protoporphyrin O-methyltransferase